jgi:hypothetical protein
VANHDFHYCSCGATFVDGGFDYFRYGSIPGYRVLRSIQVTVPQSKKELLNDYVKAYPGFNSTRTYGTLSWDEVRSLYRSQLKKDIRMVAAKAGSKKESPC